MLIKHVVEDDVLHLQLSVCPAARRPPWRSICRCSPVGRHARIVRVQVPSADPSLASLSVLARARQLCEHLGVPMAVVVSGATDPSHSAA